MPEANTEENPNNRSIRIQTQSKLELLINGKPRMTAKFWEEYENENPGIALWSAVLHAYGHRRN